MDFDERLDHVVALLRQRGRVSYRALRQQFRLDEEGIEALKDELIDAQRLARDEAGEVLVWTGEVPLAAPPATTPPDPEQPQASGPAQPTQIASASAEPHAPEAERRWEWWRRWADSTLVWYRSLGCNYRCGWGSTPASSSWAR